MKHPQNQTTEAIANHLLSVDTAIIAATQVPPHQESMKFLTVIGNHPRENT